MPKEELVASRPLLKAPVELIELPDEGLTQILIVTCQRCLSRIREDCDSSLTQLNEFGLNAKIYGVLSPSTGIDVQVSLEFSPMIARDQ
jgi:hypothetical protein